jgi:cytochrome c oxidase subunit 1
MAIRKRVRQRVKPDAVEPKVDQSKAPQEEPKQEAAVEHHEPLNVPDHIHDKPQTFFRKYIFSTDHKVIGIQFLITGLLFFILGGGLAFLVRWQLAYPDTPFPFAEFMPQQLALQGGAMTPDGYNVFFTMHASAMIFYVIIPLLVGAFGNYLIPLQIGTRDMAFPFLNALAFWTALPAGLFMVGAFFVEGNGATTGWTAYPPVSIVTNQHSEFFPAIMTGQSFWLISLVLLGLSSMMGAINYVTTIVNMRAPGMTMFRMPLTIWTLFITSILILFATPVLTAALLMLLSDRVLNTSFFMPEGGGQPLLFQHLFWFYSHPAVYIMILPGMGIVSEIMPVFSRKPIFGYRAMVYAIAGIAGLGFIVWGHHMFQSGMNPLLGTTFMISTMAIAVPSAIKTFNWLGTLWGGIIRFTTPMLFALGFVSMFVIGGLSGIFMASTSVDTYIHDTYFIVGHIHYVLFGGSVFAIFAGIYFWFPKMFGRQMDERLGKVHFWLTFVSYNFTFFPMHIIGIGGMMRRIAKPTLYEHLEHWQWMNVFISISAFTLGLAQIPFIINFVGGMFARRNFNIAWRGVLNGLTAIFVGLWAGTYIDFLIRGAYPTEEMLNSFNIIPWIYTMPALGLTLVITGATFFGMAVMRGLTVKILAIVGSIIAALPYAKIADFMLIEFKWALQGLETPAEAYAAPVTALMPILYDPISLVILVLLSAVIAVYLGLNKIDIGTIPGDNPWQATTLEWQISSPPWYANYKEIPRVYHGPYEYGVPGLKQDWLPQTDPTKIQAPAH